MTGLAACLMVLAAFDATFDAAPDACWATPSLELELELETSSQRIGCRLKAGDSHDVSNRNKWTCRS